MTLFQTIFELSGGSLLAINLCGATIYNLETLIDKKERGIRQIHICLIKKDTFSKQNLYYIAKKCSEKGIRLVVHNFFATRYHEVVEVVNEFKHITVVNEKCFVMKQDGVAITVCPHDVTVKKGENCTIITYQ